MCLYSCIFQGRKLLQAADGTFIEEPGSGAVATIDNKRVSVGTLDWVQRYGVSDISLSWCSKIATNALVAYYFKEL